STTTGPGGSARSCAVAKPVFSESAEYMSISPLTWTTTAGWCDSVRSSSELGGSMERERSPETLIATSSGEAPRTRTHSPTSACWIGTAAFSTDLSYDNYLTYHYTVAWPVCASTVKL